MPQPDTKDSAQSILNRSYEPTFEILKTLLYGYDGTALQPVKVDASGNVETADGLGIPRSDYLGFTNADGNGNYQTLTFKSGGSGGSTPATLALTFDASNKITSITKT